MLRYNLQYHQKADQFVQQTGNWDFTVYMGHYREWEDNQIVHDWLAFMPMHNDSRHYVEGLPIYVLVNETDIRFTDVSECFKILDQVSINDHYAKGRRMFRKMEQQYWADDFAMQKNVNTFVKSSKLCVDTLTNPLKTTICICSCKRANDSTVVSRLFLTNKPTPTNSTLGLII